MSKQKNTTKIDTKYTSAQNMFPLRAQDHLIRKGMALGTLKVMGIVAEFRKCISGGECGRSGEFQRRGRRHRENATWCVQELVSRFLSAVGMVGVVMSVVAGSHVRLMCDMK